ncbi:MAG: peroxidase-related enzyme [Dehalococcoidia bacterium]
MATISERPEMETEQSETTTGMENRISWFPTIEEEQFDERVRAMAEQGRARYGFLPNVFKIWAWKPERFLKWRAHLNDLMQGTPGLSEGERELIAATVSFENRCIYCLTSHSANARMLLGDPILVDRASIDPGHARLDERTEAMLDYALKITRHSADCSEADIERLRSCGFADEDIWDIAEVAAMYNMTNRLASAAGMLPNPEYGKLGH